MSWNNIPRNHYLLIHDALRKVCASVGSSASAPMPPPKLSAFVQKKHPFQCDMLINSRLTDPSYLSLPSSASSSHSSSNSSSSSNSPFVPVVHHDPKAAPRYQRFLHLLQTQLGMCCVLPGPHTGRVDIQFRDQTIVRVALGAALEDLLPPNNAADAPPEPSASSSSSTSTTTATTATAHWINTSPLAASTHARARIRLSLGGYDAALFVASCTPMERRAARQLWESSRDYCRRRPLALESHPAVRRMRLQSPSETGALPLPLEELLPPEYYWLAHAHEAAVRYDAVTTPESEAHYNNGSHSLIRHHLDLMRVVREHSAEKFALLPLHNPFFPGENLNTMAEVVWWIALFQSVATAREYLSQQQALVEAIAATTTASRPPDSSVGEGDSPSTRPTTTSWLRRWWQRRHPPGPAPVTRVATELHLDTPPASSVSAV